MKQKIKRWIFEPISQKLGRYVGLTVFLVGVALLLFTFFTAYKMFLNINDVLPLGSKIDEMVGRIVLLLLLLLAMGLVSSVIALRGADLFAATHQKIIADKPGESDKTDDNN